MSKLKFYKLISIGLLVLNVLVIAFFFIGGPPHHKNDGRIGLSKTLKLDKKQDKIFIETAHAHFEKMQELNDKQRQLLQEYFSTIAKNDNNSKDQFLHALKEVEENKITGTYEHLKEVKAILRPEQIPHFDQFIQMFLNIKKGHKKNKSHHSKDK